MRKTSKTQSEKTTPPARAMQVKSQKAPAKAASAETRARSAAALMSKEVGGDERRHLIAEAAYYRAEQRSFAPGNELEDWRSAEAEIEQMITRMNGERMPRKN